MLSSATQNDFSDLNGRVTFMPHDLFMPQPVTGAAAYLLRYITHNWSDEDCVRIFRALVPALEKSPPETRLLINDVVLPALGESTRYHDHRVRQIDIMMMLMLGAKQRTQEQFQHLLTEADPRLKVSMALTFGKIAALTSHRSKPSTARATLLSSRRSWIPASPAEAEEAQLLDQPPGRHHLQNKSWNNVLSLTCRSRLGL
jgi:hypothetical protein